VSALKDLFRLAMSDYWHERLLSACSILGLTAVLTPLLVLLGVRHGLLAAMTEKLLRDPRTLEITPVGSGKYAPEWFTELASLPETAFVVPQTRSIAATMTLRKYDGNASLRPVITPLIATGADDPLLLHRNLPRASWIREESSDSSIKMPPEMTDANTRLAAGVIVSESVMRKLGGAVDDLLEGRVDRVRSGKRESAGLPLRVLAVLPPEAQPSDMLYVPLELLTASEDYRDGKGVPFLGWSGDPPPDNGPCRHTDRNPAHPNEVAKPFMASRLALGRGPNPSQASAPERNPALQGGVGAISGMKAGISDHKGSSDEVKQALLFSGAAKNRRSCCILAEIPFIFFILCPFIQKKGARILSMMT
jgi:hypothetical protein